MVQSSLGVTERMTDWKMYGEIQQKKKEGFRKTQAARKLGINFRTVKKYWDMPPDEYALTLEDTRKRFKKGDIYEEELVSWLKDNPDMSSAQLYDWLKERHGDAKLSDRTLRLYVAHLRLEYNIPKRENFRQYEALEDPPMGYQAQVDMGQIWLKKADGKRTQVYCFAMVLSHSRYKFVYWTDRPFTTQMFMDAHNKAFAYFEGKPKEIVYDQDKVLAVSENSGDIIYTEGFQQYISIMKFKVYLCKGADPETKGRVEAVVKYAKYNFAKHRIFDNIDDFNQRCLAWLERTGNAKVHEITKKIPAEVFALEKQHLMPVPAYENISSSKILPYIVRKDNTVLYKSNRYRVPKGTYKPGLKVNLLIDNGSMVITDIETGEIYARHKISVEKGKLISLNHQERDLNNKQELLHQKAFKSLLYLDEARVLLDAIKKDKPRYFKDQLGVILRICEEIPDPYVIRQALHYCVEKKLWSAGDFRSSMEYFKELQQEPHKASPLVISKIPPKYKGKKPKVRDINEYKKAMKGCVAND